MAPVPADTLIEVAMIDFMALAARVRQVLVESLREKPLTPDEGVRTVEAGVDGDAIPDRLRIEARAGYYVVGVELSAAPTVPSSTAPGLFREPWEYFAFRVAAPIPAVTVDDEAQQLTIGAHAFPIAGELAADDLPAWREIGDGLARTLTPQVARLAATGVPYTAAPLKIIYGDAETFREVMAPLAARHPFLRQLIASLEHDPLGDHAHTMPHLTVVTPELSFLYLRKVSRLAMWWNNLSFPRSVAHEATHLNDAFLAAASDPHPDPWSARESRDTRYPDQASLSQVWRHYFALPSVRSVAGEDLSCRGSDSSHLTGIFDDSCDSFHHSMWKFVAALPGDNYSRSYVSQGPHGLNLGKFPGEFVAEMVANGAHGTPEGFTAPPHLPGLRRLWEMMLAAHGDANVLGSLCLHAGEIIHATEDYGHAATIAPDETMIFSL